MYNFSQCTVKNFRINLVFAKDGSTLLINFDIKIKNNQIFLPCILNYFFQALIFLSVALATCEEIESDSKVEEKKPEKRGIYSSSLGYGGGGYDQGLGGIGGGYGGIGGGLGGGLGYGAYSGHSVAPIAVSRIAYGNGYSGSGLGGKKYGCSLVHFNYLHPIENALKKIFS